MRKTIIYLGVNEKPMIEVVNVGGKDIRYSAIKYDEEGRETVRCDWSAQRFMEEHKTLNFDRCKESILDFGMNSQSLLNKTVLSYDGRGLFEVHKNHRNRYTTDIVRKSSTIVDGLTRNIYSYTQRGPKDEGVGNLVCDPNPEIGVLASYEREMDFDKKMRMVFVMDYSSVGPKPYFKKTFYQYNGDKLMTTTSNVLLSGGESTITVTMNTYKDDLKIKTLRTINGKECSNIEYEYDERGYLKKSINHEYNFEPIVMHYETLEYDEWCNK